MPENESKPTYKERLEAAKSYTEMNDLFVDALKDTFNSDTFEHPSHRLSKITEFAHKAATLVDSAVTGSQTSQKVEAFARMAEQARQVIINVHISSRD